MILGTHNAQLHGPKTTHTEDLKDFFSLVNKPTPNATAAENIVMPNSYNVFALPLEAPSFGERSLVINPANSEASPFGWHDTNGISGAEFTITRGNNVWAQEDRDGSDNTFGMSAEGGSNLEFNFPLNLNQSPGDYLDASLTNLFYWNNIVHDIFYLYGFDERSGNFQVNNYGKGGTGNDAVIADGQDSARFNNATFSRSVEGQSPRMTMYLYNRTNPLRDVSFDNGILIHEYGHGISDRLVGGPNQSVLGGDEQMGEGWSDWFGLMLTMTEADTPEKIRGIGTYASGESTSAIGLRPTHYTTDRSINDAEYGDIISLAVPHGVGYAFATILWDMTWALIDEEGFDSNLYRGSGGNNIALQLVVEGLKNTANNPGFVAGRDGILEADRVLFNGKYNCLIWKAFAERGVGEEANENNDGASNSRFDQTVSFKNPCFTGSPGDVEIADEDCSGIRDTFPYRESFEISGWRNGRANDINWGFGSGRRTEETGPASASDGTNYLVIQPIFAEEGEVGVLFMPCLDFSTLQNPRMTFDYHMFGADVGTLAIQTRTNNEGEWDVVFEEKGNLGDQWNTSTVSLNQYGNEASVQIRFVAIAFGGLQNAIAVDNFVFDSAEEVALCSPFLFEENEISSYGGQDNAGDFRITNEQKSIVLENNTWKSIPFDYEITENTVMEFEFSSAQEGEIHAIGFETDNRLDTSSGNRFFKVFGTQNYGITNFDDYATGTKQYVIPVGQFYTGSFDRLVLVNDNDGGSGNTSLFSNVNIYDGSCDGSAVSQITNSIGKRAVLGTEREESAFSVTLQPNPANDRFELSVKSNSKNSLLQATFYTILGKEIKSVALAKGNSSFSASELGMSAGIYLIRITADGQEHILRKLVVAE